MKIFTLTNLMTPVARNRAEATFVGTRSPGEGISGAMNVGDSPAQGGVP